MTGTRGACHAAMTAFILLAACSCSSTGKSNSASGGGRQVTAKPVGGRSGTPPLLVPDGQRQVVLRDRVLIVKNVRKQVAGDTAAIRVAVVFRNTGVVPLDDQTNQFQVVTLDGDVFQAHAAQPNVGAGAIAGGASRNTTLVFDVPVAAVPSLRLAYRPTADAQTIFMQLHAS